MTQAMTETTTIARPWWRLDARAWLAAALVLAAAAAMWPSWQHVVRLARQDAGLSYIAFVPLLAVALFFVRRRRMAALRTIGHWVGPAIALAGVGMYVSSYPLSIDVFRHGGGVLMMIGGIVAVLGVDALRRFAPALLVLFFMVPPSARVISLIALPLEFVSSIVTVDVLRAFGVPIERAGNLLTVNGHPVNVAEACSGVRGAFALLLVLYGWVFIHRFRLSARLLFLVLAVPIALTSNIGRLIPTALAHGYADAGTAQLAHDLLGLIMFAFAVLACQGLAAALAWAGFGLSRGAWSDEAVEPRVWRWTRSAWAGVALTVVVLGGVGISNARGEMGGGFNAEAYHAKVRDAFIEMPMVVGDWRAEPAPLTAPATRLLRPNAVHSVRFVHRVTRRSFAFSMIHCNFARDMGSHAPPVCFPNNGWQPGGQEVMALPFEEQEQAIPVQEYTFRRVTEHGPLQIKALNFYILPGQFMDDYTQMHERSKLPWIDAQGVARVQLVFDPTFSLAERRELTQACIDAYAPTFRVILQQDRDATP